MSNDLETIIGVVIDIGIYAKYITGGQGYRLF